MHLAVVGAVFPLVFVGELPDKTMFASLVLSSRGRALPVWIGAAAAFLVHVVIAVSVGVAIFSVLPNRAVDAVVAVLFAIGAVLAFAISEETEEHEAEEIARATTTRRMVFTAFLVVFVAEWGDLTQILTANLAARYHAPLSVGVGATLALWAVAAIAVVGGQGLLRYLPVAVVRRVTGGVLVVLAIVAAVAAIRG
ncbi:MAG TPA: TMEM165/GDT1 family protein [Acidimicrobiia bacterium]|nr:TMEM165/GDT1 family protein [Acidimicrobiia bacterium]